MLTLEDDFEELLSFENIPFDHLQGKTVLITGATGMLASYLTKFLIYADRKKALQMQFILAVRNTEKARSIYQKECRQENVQLYQTDLKEKIDITVPVHFILHAASLADPQYYKSAPVDVLLPNTLGAYHCLELARQMPCEGFLFFSSSEIYGSVSEEGPIREDSAGLADPLSERSCYSESKRMGETMCRAYCTQYGIPVKIARIFHSYGPTMDCGKDQRVFSEFVHSVITENKIVMKSSGEAMRPFCYALDFAAACLVILLRGEKGEAYNIANDECFLSVRQLAEKIAGIFPERHIPVIRRQRQPQDAYPESKVKNRQNISTKKLRALGWKPTIPAEEGFRRTILMLEQNR